MLGAIQRRKGDKGGKVLLCFVKEVLVKRVRSNLGTKSRCGEGRACRHINCLTLFLEVMNKSLYI